MNQIEETANVILRKRIDKLEEELKMAARSPEEIREAVLDGLRLYFDHHSSATKNNIGSIWKRIDRYLRG